MNIRPLLLIFAAVVAFGSAVRFYRALHPYDPSLPPAGQSNEPPARADETSFELRAEEVHWKPIGTGPVAINAKGNMKISGYVASPGKSYLTASDDAPAPGLQRGILVAKIGETGRPFKCGGVCKIAVKGNIYLAINDSPDAEHSGFYTVTVRRVSSGGQQ